MEELQVIIFDTETTGLIKTKSSDIHDQPQIIEYYGMRVVHRADGVIEKVAEFETYFKPAKPFDEAIITKITGISNAMVKDAPSFFDKHKELLEFYKGAHRMVAHNCAFDDAMVKNEFLRLATDDLITVDEFNAAIDQIQEMKRLCTVQKTMFFQQRRLTLTNLHQELFGVPFEGAHRARADVEGLFRCYEELCKRGVIETTMESRV
jgi:DNA polymerase III epsilon subunit-like protein